MSKTDQEYLDAINKARETLVSAINEGMAVGLIIECKVDSSDTYYVSYNVSAVRSTKATAQRKYS